MNFAETFEEFIRVLRQHEIETNQKYIVYTGQKRFTEDKVQLTASMKLHWHDGIPYFHFGRKTYVCHNGKDNNVYKKNKYAQERDAKAMTHFVKRYQKKKPTKKLDCPAKFNVVRAFIMPEYKIADGMVTDCRKNTVSCRIRQKIKNGENVLGNQCFMFKLPSLQEHENHLLEKSAAVKPVAVRRKKKVSNVDKRNAITIPELLAVFASKEHLELDGSSKDTISDCDETFVQVSSETPVEHEYEDSETELALYHLENNSFHTDHSIMPIPAKKQLSNLKVRVSNKQHLTNKCNDTIQSIQSAMLYLDEPNLSKLSQTLTEVFQDISNHVTTDHDSDLPILDDVEMEMARIGSNKKETQKVYKKLAIRKK